jgi:hypothetical protein
VFTGCTIPPELIGNYDLEDGFWNCADHKLEPKLFLLAI